MTAIRVTCLLALLGYGFLFGLVLLRARHRRAARYFLFYLLAMAIWQGGQTVAVFTEAPEVALQAYRVLLAFGYSFGFFYAMFVRELLGIRSGRWLVRAGYTSVVGVPLYMLAGGPGLIESVYKEPAVPFFLPHFGAVAVVFGIGVYGFLAYAFVHLLRARLHSTSPEERNRLAYLLMGVPIVIVGSVFNFSPQLRAYPLDVIANLINAMLTGLAIVRYRLLDIQVVVRKGLRYTSVTAAVGLIYFALVFLAIQVLHFVSGYQVLLLSLVMATVAAVAVQPLRDVLQARVDKTFFREKYDTAQMLQRLSRTAAATLDIDRLTNLIVAEVTNTMHIERAAFFLKDGTSGLRLASGLGLDGARQVRLRHDHPVIATMARDPQPFVASQLDRMPLARAFTLQEREQWEKLDMALLVPVTAQGALVGVLAVGEKRSGVGYSRDDRIALTTLANQTAVAVENARLYAAAQHELAERQRAETAMRASLQEKEVLLKEIHHRVKNNLQMIYSLLSLQSQYADDPTTLEALRDSQNRIRSMALIHEKLYQSTNLADIDFGEYLRSLASHLHRSYAVKDRNVRLIVSTAPIRLGIDTALPCALIASELISNALKHAFVGRPEGVLRVNIGTDDRGTIRLEVEDNGVGLRHESETSSPVTLGMQLVDGLVRQLNGTLTTDDTQGTRFVIAFSTPGK